MILQLEPLIPVEVMDGPGKWPTGKGYCLAWIEMDRVRFWPNKENIRQVFERLGVVFIENGSIRLGNKHRKIETDDEALD